MFAQAKHPITSAQIQQALRNFQARGGLIRKLPDQKIPVLAPVGSRAQIFAAEPGVGWVSDRRSDDQ